MVVQLEQEEPTMAERQPGVELAADAWVLARRPVRVASLVEEVQAVEPCPMWGLDRASTSRRQLTSM